MHLLTSSTTFPSGFLILYNDLPMPKITETIGIMLALESYTYKRKYFGC